MAKTAFVLGLVTSLIGGIAPRFITADGNINVVVRGEANVSAGFGKAQAKLITKTTVSQTAGTKKTTKAAIKKGNKTMTTINSIKKGVGKASALPGE